MFETKTVRFLVVLLCIVAVLTACSPELDQVTPEPSPTPTRPQGVPHNENVEALNAARAALDRQDFGFAPLLQAEAAKIVLETINGVETAHLTYPQQPADPSDWPSVDSFVSAYSIRHVMTDMSQVTRVAIGHLNIPASIDNSAENIDHSAAWITFLDGSRAVIDLSPLATNFASRHIPDRMMVDSAEIEAIFEDRRTGVNLDRLQPMLVQTEDGQLYYSLAKVQVSFDRYTFSLYTHPLEPADPMVPMNIRPGVVAQIAINRDEFVTLQELALETGPTLFEDEPHLLDRQGSSDEIINEVLDDNLPLLWHLITKFEHQNPDATIPTPTPSITPTPIPSATPTPTATPKKMPLVTS